MLINVYNSWLNIKADCENIVSIIKLTPRITRLTYITEGKVVDVDISNTTPDEIKEEVNRQIKENI